MVLDTLINSFRGKIPLPGMGRPAHVWNMWEHKTWGDNIEWLNFSERRISGHFRNTYNPDASVQLLQDKATCRKGMPYKLAKGDEIRCRMRYGRVAKFRITELEYKSDPPDMFFGTVKDIGYVED